MIFHKNADACIVQVNKQPGTASFTQIHACFLKETVMKI